MTDCEQYEALLRRWVDEFRPYMVAGDYWRCDFCEAISPLGPGAVEHRSGCLVGDTLRALGEGK